MPAARAILAAGLATAVMAVAVAVPWMAAAALLLDALIVIALVVDARRAARRRRRAARVWPPMLVQGVPTALTVRPSEPTRHTTVARENAIRVRTLLAIADMCPERLGSRADDFREGPVRGPATRGNCLEDRVQRRPVNPRCGDRLPTADSA